MVRMTTVKHTIAMECQKHRNRAAEEGQESFLEEVNAN